MFSLCLSRFNVDYLAFYEYIANLAFQVVKVML